MNATWCYILPLFLTACDADQTHQQAISPQQQFAFEKMDLNNSGDIDVEEWSKQVNLTAAEIYVTNKGQSEEYKSMMLNLFTKLDVNRDNSLSRSELIEPR